MTLPPRTGLGMRRWLLGLLLIGLGLFAWSNRAELLAVAEAWRGARWTWLGLAVLLQAGFQLATAAMYRASLRVTGERVTVTSMVPTYLGAMAVNVVAPSGGATGTSWMVDRLYRRGADPARSTAGLILARALSFSSFLVVYVIALWLMLGMEGAWGSAGIDGAAADGLLLGGAWTGAVAVAAVALGHLGLLLLAARAPDALGRLLRWVERGQRRFRARFRPHAAPPAWSAEVADELERAAQAVWAAPWAVLAAFALALVAYACDLACLRAVFAAFDLAIPLDVMIAGYALGTLFWVVPITPQGIGLVEGTMAVAYAGLGVPGTVAAAVALAFRGVNFWLPLGVGVAALRGGATVDPSAPPQRKAPEE